MNIFIWYVIEVLLLGVLFKKKSRKYSLDRTNFNYEVKTNYKIYFLFCGLTLLLIAALRNVSVGRDTRSYFIDFEMWRNTNILDFFAGVKKDAGLKILTKMMGFFTESNQIILTIVGAFFAIAVCWFIYKYSKEPVISFIAILSLGFVYFSLSGLKQTVAMSICLFSYKYVREQKFFKFLLLMTVAYFFHNTSIVFIVAFFLPKLKVNRKQMIISALLALLVAINFQSQVKYFLFNILNWDRITIYETVETTNSLTGFIIQLSIMVFSLFFLDKVKSIDPKDLLLYKFSYVGLIIQPFSIITGDIFRVSMYFSIFNIILIANAVASEKDKKLRIILYYSVILLLLLYFFIFAYDSSGIYPYKFFWE